jgi:hypothetical protein
MHAADVRPNIDGRAKKQNCGLCQAPVRTAKQRASKHVCQNASDVSQQSVTPLILQMRKIAVWLLMHVKRSAFLPGCRACIPVLPLRIASNRFQIHTWQQQQQQHPENK